MDTLFEWDAAKAESNLRKHGIQFDEATAVFDDPYCLMEQDRIEQGEQRWQTIGMVNGFLLLLVAHTVHEDNAEVVMRIISARRANRKERQRYEHG